jgi:biotin synthase
MLTCEPDSSQETGCPMLTLASKPEDPRATKFSFEEAVEFFSPQGPGLWDLVARANGLREKAFGKRVHLCAILNAKSGGCSEDCAFCAQSGRHSARIQRYPLVSTDKALAAAKEACSWRVRCFSLVTSGKAIAGSREKARLLKTVESIRSETDLQVAASLGFVEPAFLRDLKAAGLSTYHHNLETAPSFFPQICSTHTFDQKLRTIGAAREAGLTVCSGAIFGLGESAEQRAELSLLLRDLGVDRVPVNFLHPIPGTPLENRQGPSPLEALRILSALRILLPDRDILVCGGRESSLRTLQPLLFLAGANGLMVGNYLTTTGPGFERDRKMLEDLGLEWQAPASRQNP